MTYKQVYAINQYSTFENSTTSFGYGTEYKSTVVLLFGGVVCAQ